MKFSWILREIGLQCMSGKGEEREEKKSSGRRWAKAPGDDNGAAVFMRRSRRAESEPHWQQPSISQLCKVHSRKSLHMITNRRRKKLISTASVTAGRGRCNRVRATARGRLISRGVKDISGINEESVTGSFFTDGLRNVPPEEKHFFFLVRF